MITKLCRDLLNNEGSREVQISYADKAMRLLCPPPMTSKGNKQCHYPSAEMHTPSMIAAFTILNHVKSE